MGQLLGEFRWGEPRGPQTVRDGLADVLTYCLLLADILSMYPLDIDCAKPTMSREKHPADKARSRSATYDELRHRAAPLHRHGCKVIGMLAKALTQPSVSGVFWMSVMSGSLGILTEHSDF